MSVSNRREEKTEILKKLLNFLKLPKAQRWVCCEWFYSDIDRVIFESENDFALCLKQSFPSLKATKLRRKQWCIVRRLIGKPRRCSDAFFQEERQMLEEKRHKIRMIQQRKLNEQDLLANDLKELPECIPLPLSIGNRVYAHITQPEEGVFLGTIAAVDPCEHTYRVVFDRASLGSRTLADFEIKSLLPPVQAVPIRAYLQTYRPKFTPGGAAAATSASIGLTPTGGLQTNVNLQSLLLMNTPRFGTTPLSTSNILLDDLNALNATNPAIAAALAFHSNVDPMLGVNSPLKPTTTGTAPAELLATTPLKTPHSQLQLSPSTAAAKTLSASPIANALYGNFPVQLLLMSTRLNKILLVKKDLVRKLTQMNAEAERIKANGQSYSSEFQINYAQLVLDLEKLNKDLSEYLNGVESFTNETEESGGKSSRGGESASESGGEEHDTSNNSQASSSHHGLISNGRGASKETSLRESMDLVSRLTAVSGGTSSSRSIDLIVRLTSMLLQVKSLVNANANLIEQRRERDDACGSSSVDDEEIENSTMHHFVPFSTKTLAESINEIKGGLSSAANTKLFEDKVQVHMNHIESVLCHYNKLNAFKYDVNQN